MTKKLALQYPPPEGTANYSSRLSRYLSVNFRRIEDFVDKIIPHAVTITTDAALAAHEGASNPHPVYSTDVDLAAHAATPHGHPNLATHDSMGLATDSELATHAATPHGPGVENVYIQMADPSPVAIPSLWVELDISDNIVTMWVVMP